MLETIVALTLFDVAGIAGVMLYLGSYAVLQLGFISGRGYIYPALNAGAASCVMVSLIQDFNLSSLLIQISFIAISVYGISRLFVARNLRGYTVDQEAFMEYALPTIDREFSGELAKMGVWAQAPAGTIVTVEGRKVRDLVYIADGKAEVSLNNIPIATIHERSLLGEVTCMDGDPATATVTLTRPSRIMRINAEKLRAVLRAKPEMRSQLENSIKSDMASKLAHLNREVMITKAMGLEVPSTKGKTAKKNQKQKRAKSREASANNVVKLPATASAAATSATGKPTSAAARKS